METQDAECGKHTLACLRGLLETLRDCGRFLHFVTIGYKERKVWEKTVQPGCYMARVAPDGQVKDCGCDGKMQRLGECKDAL